MRITLLGLGLCLLALPALAQSAAERRYQRELHGIKGTDQRVRVEATQFPWSAVGRLNNGQGGHCSGTLIGPKLVATAAHCLWSQRARRALPASAFTFVAGYDRGEYLRASKVVAVHPSPDWRFEGENRPLSTRAHDWMLLELEEAVGDDIGWIAMADPFVGQMVGVAGYGKDKAFVPLVHLGCHLIEQPLPGVLFHDCDAVQGESGGPVLALVAGELRLVGINVAVIPSKGEMGVAAAITPLAAEARGRGAATTTRRGPLSQPPSGNPAWPKP